MRALIGTNGIVGDVRPDGEEFPAANPWVAAPPGVEIGWLYDAITETFTAPVVPADPTQLNNPYLSAVALLTITPGEISGIGVASKFSAAIYFDVGLYYLFFAETQADTEYLANAYDATTKVDVIEKTADYIVITAVDAAGVPADPAQISVQIIRIS